MSPDEHAIRELVATWFAASEAGDVQTVLGLMSDDAIFMVPGAQPFGKQAFAQAAENMKRVRVEGHGEIHELQVMGDWAYLRNHIRVTITPPNGRAVKQAGYTLTILRKEADGRWRVVRDANLLSAESAPAAGNP
jgi:uncharacterized protein (TIGR02246 family)